MPHLTQWLYRKPPLIPQGTSQIFPMIFKEVLPLKLRNRVSYKSSREERPETCLQQMTEVFECLKKNEFDQSVCAKQITAFKTCTEASRATEINTKKLRKQGVLIPDSPVLTARQANVLLGKRYPQHNVDMPDRWNLTKHK